VIADNGTAPGTIARGLAFTTGSGNPAEVESVRGDFARVKIRLGPRRLVRRIMSLEHIRAQIGGPPAAPSSSEEPADDRYSVNLSAGIVRVLQLTIPGRAESIGVTVETVSRGRRVRISGSRAAMLEFARECWRATYTDARPSHGKAAARAAGIICAGLNVEPSSIVGARP
jgi:hypothetical protein